MASARFLCSLWPWLALRDAEPFDGTDLQMGAPMRLDVGWKFYHNLGRELVKIYVEQYLPRPASFQSDALRSSAL